jgi:hypothetical protein
MAEDAGKKKEELIRLLGEVGPQARKLEVIGQELVQFARFTSDVAGPLGELIAQIPDDRLPVDEWSRQVAGWRSWQDTARQLQASQTMINSFGAMTEAVTNTSVSGVMPVISSGALFLPPAPPIEIPKTKLFQTLDRYPLIARATASMRRLGLDKRGGTARTPLDLLEEARGALDRPVIGDGGPVSVLVSLRECIDAVITELVRRRPRQEVTKGWKGKVTSVGCQCARPMLSPDHFDRLGLDAESLMNQLSGAKQGGMGRDQLAEFFNQGLLFLNALMDSIDEAKVRPS